MRQDEWILLLGKATGGDPGARQELNRALLDLADRASGARWGRIEAAEALMEKKQLLALIASPEFDELVRQAVRAASEPKN